MDRNRKEKFVKRIYKTGTEKREEKRKRDLGIAAADPKQTRLFQPAKKKSRTLNVEDIPSTLSSSISSCSQLSQSNFFCLSFTRNLLTCI